MPLISTDETDRRKIRIPKLDAARRQLDCAIELWFANGDEVSIHALASAAYQIVDDVNAKRQAPYELLYNSVVVKDEHRHSWILHLKRAVNFFKHADRDAEHVLEFFPVSSLLFMMSAIDGLAKLTGQYTDHGRTFVAWLSLHKPTWVNDQIVQFLANAVPAEEIASLKTIPKDEFLHSLLGIVEHLRGPHG